MAKISNETLQEWRTQALMPFTNKVIIDMSNSLDNIQYRFEWENKVNKYLIDRYKDLELVKIMINDCDMYSLDNVKSWLLSSSDKQIRGSRIYIETLPTKKEIQNKKELVDLFLPI